MLAMSGLAEQKQTNCSFFLPFQVILSADQTNQKNKQNEIFSLVMLHCESALAASNWLFEALLCGFLGFSWLHLSAAAQEAPSGALGSKMQRLRFACYLCH